MYGIYELADGVAQIALPTPPGITRPFGFPYNVYVLHGDASAAVVGTGFAGSRDALLAALYELGVDPRRVQRVLLTSALPECAGNVELFERATVLGAGPSLALEATERAADVARMARALARDARNPTWDEAAVDAFVEAYAGATPTHIDAIAVEDGDRVALSGTELEILLTPGVGAAALCAYDAHARRLFGGDTVQLATPPRFTDADALLESLRRLVQLQPAEILPARGGVERSFAAVFRSLSLSINNLLTNLPFAMSGPTALAEMCYRDLGYWPDDLVRFAGTLLRYERMLDTLVRTGVAHREGEGAWAVYSMDRPSRMGT